MKKCALRHVAAAVRSLETLSKLKEADFVSPSVRNDQVDYHRALMFLQQGDPLGARQAAIEELRHHPSSLPARRLLVRLNDSLQTYLDPPAAIVEQEPLFGMLYAALRDHTMLTWTRMFSLYRLTKTLCENRVAGDIVECGCAGGGSVVLMAATSKYFDALASSNGTPAPLRRIFACDTFRGMPSPTGIIDATADDVPAGQTSWSTGTCRGSADHLRALGAAFDANITPIEGLFSATLPVLVAENRPEIALLHCDADWFESTAEVLDHLLPRLVRNASTAVQVDDYHYWSGVRKAVDERIPAHRLQDVDSNAVVVSDWSM